MASDSEQVKCRYWVPSAPRPHFCSLQVIDTCKKCKQTYCQKHIERHQCD